MLAAGAYLAGLRWDAALVRLVAKPVPVLCLALLVRRLDRGLYGSLVLAGLALSLVGDVLLELAGGFLPGLGAFLIAHLCYLGAFVAGERRPAAWRALPFAAWGALAYARLAPALGAMLGPVTAYILVICTMMWRSAARVGSAAASRFSGWSALLGAVLFGLSDTLIAFDRFQAPIPGVRYPIILLYWAGQAAIALSVNGSRSRGSG